MFRIEVNVRIATSDHASGGGGYNCGCQALAAVGRVGGHPAQFGAEGVQPGRVVGCHHRGDDLVAGGVYGHEPAFDRECPQFQETRKIPVEPIDPAPSHLATGHRSDDQEPGQAGGAGMSRWRSAVLLCLALLFNGCVGLPENVEPVADFELERYLGKWYEIARLDHS